MADAAPHLAGSQTIEGSTPAPKVSIIITSVEGADLETALTIVRRQAYEPSPELVVVGDSSEPPPDVTAYDGLEQAIADMSPDVDYLWILHADARPRPDALAKLVSETERNEASLAGSKLLIAGTKDILESVGSATDVFGEPYSGLEEGEIDLQQYDVVREVAFVRSASMLVRRDLAQGLKGLDDLLPPVAAGLDFSQRARLAGGKVIIVPSSEVYHQGRCNEGGTGWREQAGRLRAMVTAYSPLTLLWVLPYDFLVSVIDAIGSLVLFRWKPAARHLRSWLWNTYHLPSTIGLRRRFKPVRSKGDEELFRFQARGSVRLRELGSELTSKVLLAFDEDQAILRGSRRMSSSPGIWGAVLAVLVLLIGVRGLVLLGVPDTGFSFPFEPSEAALERWLEGWNDTGLGSPSSVHPVVGVAGAVSWALFGFESAARTLLTIAFGFVGVVGVGRFAGRIGVRGPGRYLAGIVALGGPGIALLTGAGSWTGLGAAALLPWAARATVTHQADRQNGWSRLGWAVITGLLLGSFSPALAIVPLVAAMLLWLLGARGGLKFVLGLVVLTSGVLTAANFIIGDPGWLIDVDRRIGLGVEWFWPVVIGLAALPVAFLDLMARRLGLTGGILALAGLLVARLPLGGPGVEEAGLILAGFGASLVVAAGLDSFSSDVRRVLATVPSMVILLFAVVVVTDGRLGLPEGDMNERFDFASTLADPGGPGRVLVVSADRSELPGESRPGPGVWYRLVDGEEMTLDEVWLAERTGGDDRLLAALQGISTGGELRPGESLGAFAIDWIVLLGPMTQIDDALVAQLDLVPTPLDPDARVFENSSSRPIALADAGVWRRQGIAFAGEPGAGRVDIAINHDDGWDPDSEANGWALTVSAEDGEARFQGREVHRAVAMATAGALIAGLALLAAGRIRR